MPKIKKEKCGLFVDKYYKCIQTKDIKYCKWIITGWETCRLLTDNQRHKYLDKQE